MNDYHENQLKKCLELKLDLEKLGFDAQIEPKNEQHEYPETIIIYNDVRFRVFRDWKGYLQIYAYTPINDYYDKHRYSQMIASLDSPNKCKIITKKAVTAHLEHELHDYNIRLALIAEAKEQAKAALELFKSLNADSKISDSAINKYILWRGPYKLEIDKKEGFCRIEMQSYMIDDPVEFFKALPMAVPNV